MNPYWWIPITAAAVMIGALIRDAVASKRQTPRCWWCGALPGDPHRRGCQAEPRL